MTDLTDTIFALSSGAGRAGVAVFRISGADTAQAVRQLCTRLPIPRQAVLRQVQDPASKELIDEALVLWFKGPASFTGEDVAELQVHGSLAVIDRLSACLVSIGLRPADPGEFTRRAFRNGKLDLAQTEALADLIDAETDKQRQQALGQFGGNLSRLAEEWRAQLIGCLSPLEAAIDFPDEEDIPQEIERRAAPVIAELKAELGRFLAETDKAQRIRKGVSVVLLGPPNAGKSSLINWLAGSDIAIVSEIPGTTRDVLETRIELAGVPVTISDTAGLRAGTQDTIEKEGMRRAEAKASTADLRIGLLAVDDLAQAETIQAHLGPEDMLILNKVEVRGKASNRNSAQVAEGGSAHKMVDLSDEPPGVDIGISLKDQTGLESLLDMLEQKVRLLCGSAEEPALTRSRHVYAVIQASEALDQAQHMLRQSPELAAEDVRSAIQALAQITGAIGVEDILGEIFSSFCIGK